MTARRIVLTVVVIVGVAVTSCVAPRVWPTNVFLSSNAIQASLIRRTPLGSPTNSVEAYLRSANYRPRRVDMRGQETVGYPTRIAASSAIIATLPRYYLPFRVDVEAVYAFDSRGRLLGIEVNKYV